MSEEEAPAQGGGLTVEANPKEKVLDTAKLPVDKANENVERTDVSRDKRPLTLEQMLLEYPACEVEKAILYHDYPQ